MDLDRIPPWLKALAASFWVMFVLAPLIAYLTHRFGDAAVWTVVPVWVLAFVVLHTRSADDDISDAEYYRRKARNRRPGDLP